MKFLLSFFLVVFISSSSFIYGEENFISDEKISQITQRLEGYTTNELIERRNLLISYDEDNDDPNLKVPSMANTEGTPLDLAATTRAERAFEISVIEALLLALGIVIADNVSEDTTTPPDTVFPVITILGDNPATVELGSSYTDAGATSDGGETVTSSGTVDTNTVGTYTITYSASDAAGNTSTATRTVNVVDTTSPVVVLTGAATVTVELGDDYTEQGATASDASGTMTVVITGTVDTDTVGSYTVTYTSTDASGNVGTVTRTVNVVDTTAPVFTSSATFSAVENQTSIGTVTATDLQTVTFTVSGLSLIHI